MADLLMIFGGTALAVGLVARFGLALMFGAWPWPLSMWFRDPEQYDYTPTNEIEVVDYGLKLRTLAHPDTFAQYLTTKYLVEGYAFTGRGEDGTYVWYVSTEVEEPTILAGILAHAMSAREPEPQTKAEWIAEQPWAKQNRAGGRQPGFIRRFR